MLLLSAAAKTILEREGKARASEDVPPLSLEEYMEANILTIEE